jgi:hypothetical protein
MHKDRSIMSTPIPVKPPMLYQTGTLRRFSDDRIQAAIDNALAEMKPEDKMAVVAHHVYNSDGTHITKLSAVYRLPAGFSVVAGAYKDWTKGDQGIEGKIVFKA